MDENHKSLQNSQDDKKKKDFSEAKDLSLSKGRALGKLSKAAKKRTKRFTLESMTEKMKEKGNPFPGLSPLKGETSDSISEDEDTLVLPLEDEKTTKERELPYLKLPETLDSNEEKTISSEGKLPALKPSGELEPDRNKSSSQGEFPALKSPKELEPDRDKSSSQGEFPALKSPEELEPDRNKSSSQGEFPALKSPEELESKPEIEEKKEENPKILLNFEFVGDEAKDKVSGEDLDKKKEDKLNIVRNFEYVSPKEEPENDFPKTSPSLLPNEKKSTTSPKMKSTDKHPIKSRLNTKRRTRASYEEAKANLSDGVAAKMEGTTPASHSMSPASDLSSDKSKKIANSLKESLREESNILLDDIGRPPAFQENEAEEQEEQGELSPAEKAWELAKDIWQTKRYALIVTLLFFLLFLEVYSSSLSYLFGVRDNSDKTLISNSKTKKIKDPIPQTTVKTIPVDRLGWFGEAMPEGMVRNSTRGEYIWTKDQSIMAHVPQGPFYLGSKQGKKNEQPEKLVNLDPYYIDKYELSNKQYMRYVEETNAAIPSYIKNDQINKDEQPIVGVNWLEFQGYMKWAGKRLPTEAEWEKAARGGLQVPDWEGESNLIGFIENPLPKRIFPWGDDPLNDESFARFNYKESVVKQIYTYPVDNLERGVSPYGCFNMAGNVWEWCSDWYMKDYYSVMPSINPQGPVKGEGLKVCRGGSWTSSQTSTLFSFRRYREPINKRFNNIGARFAK